MALFWFAVSVLRTWAIRVYVDRRPGNRDPSEAILRRWFAIGEISPHAGSTPGAYYRGSGCEACLLGVAGPPKWPRPMQEQGGDVSMVPNEAGVNKGDERNQRPITPRQRDRVDPSECRRDEAQEARRQAAEHGDYRLAERWYRHERILASEVGDHDQPTRAQA